MYYSDLEIYPQRYIILCTAYSNVYWLTLLYSYYYLGEINQPKDGLKNNSEALSEPKFSREHAPGDCELLPLI